MTTQRVLFLVAFLALVSGGGMAIGYLTRPDDWFMQLTKPSFNPPGWLFGPVWSVLYIMIAVAGWRLWTSADAGISKWLWWLQLALNFSWSPTFFTAHQIGSALAIILLLLVTILAIISLTWHRDRVTAWLLVPYAAWVGFASVLNAAIFQLN